MRCLFEAIDRKRETSMNRENYQRRLEERLAQLKGSRPRLLLHACCAPCSTYVLEYLTQYFTVDVFFNIVSNIPPLTCFFIILTSTRGRNFCFGETRQSAFAARWERDFYVPAMRARGFFALSREWRRSQRGEDAAKFAIGCA